MKLGPARTGKLALPALGDHAGKQQHRDATDQIENPPSAEQDPGDTASRINTDSHESICHREKATPTDNAT